MEPAEILEKARAIDGPPQSWIVLPLLRNKVVTGIAGWVLGIIIGLGLFTVMASVMIPNNYEHGIASALFSTILLAIVLFVGLGSIWALFVDVNRLRHADKYLIVITPDELVKQEGEKIIHVPLMYVRHVCFWTRF